MNAKTELPLWDERRIEILASQESITNDLQELKTQTRRLEIRLNVVNRMLNYVNQVMDDLERNIDDREEE